MDPDSLNPDPYRAIQVKSGSGSKVMMTKYKKIHLNICYLLITRPPKKTSKLQEKPSALKREHTALQKMKCVNCFLFLWVIFAPFESGSNTNPQHWLAYITYITYPYRYISIKKFNLKMACPCIKTVHTPTGVNLSLKRYRCI